MTEELEHTTGESSAPENAPGRQEMSVDNRLGADVVTGSNDVLSWGARSDVGLVREHNEDSFLLRAPLFAVSDGMGGHAAGEVASSITVQTINQQAPAGADDVLLGAAVEAANRAVIQGSTEGLGKPGMGCTATAALIERDKIAIAHVGDSRIYLLHHGALVRITHDHSYVEELVDSGQITADEARVHPSRSIVTRALGSDPDMYADHFTLEVGTGDRIILCSDGLSGMITDAEIEALAVSSATPQQAADNLVAAALSAGGADNVTVIVVDILNDGLADQARDRLKRQAIQALSLMMAVFLLIGLGVIWLIRSEWYLRTNNGEVAIYQGIHEEIFGYPLYELIGTSSIKVEDLPSAVQEQLKIGIPVANEQSARDTLDAYRRQIDDDKTRAAEVADDLHAKGVTEVAPQDQTPAPASTGGAS